MNFLSYKGLKQQNICTTFVFRSKIFGLFCTYSYLCKRSSVNTGVTFVGKTITALADYSVHHET